MTAPAPTPTAPAPAPYVSRLADREDGTAPAPSLESIERLYGRKPEFLAALGGGIWSPKGTILRGRSRAFLITMPQDSLPRTEPLLSWKTSGAGRIVVLAHTDGEPLPALPPTLAKRYCPEVEPPTSVHGYEPGAVLWSDYFAALAWDHYRDAMAARMAEVRS